MPESAKSQVHHSQLTTDYRSFCSVTAQRVDICKNCPCGTGLCLWGPLHILNLRIIFDSGLKFDHYVNYIARTAFFHLK